MDALDKIIPVNDILRHVFHRFFEKKGISVAVERTWLSGFKLDRVYRIPKGQILCVWGDLIQPRKQLFRVGDGPNKNAAGTEPARNIVQHTPDFGIALKRIVHAELHRNDVEGWCQLREWDATGYGLQIAIESCESGVEA
jgi:hypothetical protein